MLKTKELTDIEKVLKALRKIPLSQIERAVNVCTQPYTKEQTDFIEAHPLLFK